MPTVSAFRVFARIPAFAVVAQLGYAITAVARCNAVSAEGAKCPGASTPVSDLKFARGVRQTHSIVNKKVTRSDGWVGGGERSVILQDGNIDFVPRASLANRNYTSLERGPRARTSISGRLSMRDGGADDIKREMSAESSPGHPSARPSVVWFELSGLIPGPNTR